MPKTFSEFSNNLIAWYLNNKRAMPWRTTRDPYRIWLSEIILQQTRVEQGLPYYISFTDTFPTVHDLAKASEEQVLKLWQGLGYYSRARNLHACAQYIVNHLNGVFPNTYEGLLQLKGVGDYTASAIASICFNQPTAVVDGNVYRVLSRVFGIDTPINSTSGKKEFKALAQQLIDPERPADFNQALMEFGAIQCKPKNPYCLHCIFNERCVALQRNKIPELPVKLTKLRIKKRYFNYLVFRSVSGETQIQQRTQKGIWQGLYEFPLLELKEKEQSVLSDVIRFRKSVYLQKATQDVRVNSITRYNDQPYVHKLSHQHLITTFWIVDVLEIPQNGVLWNTIHKYPVPVLISNFIDTFDF